jgi:hypothetical protein
MPLVANKHNVYKVCLQRYVCEFVCVQIHMRVNVLLQTSSTTATVCLVTAIEQFAAVQTQQTRCSKKGSCSG